MVGKKPLTLEEQLNNLQECGVRLRPQATVAALLEEWSREQFDEPPYSLAVVALGGEPPALSENLWHFDTECIEDHGAYVRIAERFRDLANGDLPLLAIEDFVDVDAGEAWLAFEMEGRKHHWSCRVDVDWVDPAVMSRFASLFAERRKGKRFTYLDLEGQDCMIGCFTEHERDRLCEVTGLAWEWLT